MRNYARVLFALAALSNFAVAIVLLLRPAWVPLDPASGTNAALANLCASMIAFFGAIYVALARDPARHRLFIAPMAAGKILATAAIIGTWLAGEISSALPLLMLGDVAFALLFLDYLRRTRA